MGPRLLGGQIGFYWVLVHPIRVELWFFRYLDFWDPANCQVENIPYTHTTTTTKKNLKTKESQPMPFVSLLGCPRKLVNGWKMDYNPNLSHLQVGYKPFTNHLLTSWDIQVDIQILPAVWCFRYVFWFQYLLKRLLDVYSVFGFRKTNHHHPP